MGRWRGEKMTGKKRKQMWVHESFADTVKRIQTQVKEKSNHRLKPSSVDVTKLLNEDITFDPFSIREKKKKKNE